ncbi:NUDIX hydrolase [Actinacidiphila soli]|uniref:DNA mismatch repair protein MutT n=1 Tax=Actinacidiphila soli TaxID=2487275 RepID=UPI003898F35E
MTGSPPPARGGLEDYLQAATGLDLPPQRLGPVVWVRQTLFSVDGQGFDQYEEYRLARVTSDEASAMQVGTEEARYGHYWWTIEELATTSETVRPKSMGVLLVDVLANVERRAEPLLLGQVNEDTDPVS